MRPGVKVGRYVTMLGAALCLAAAGVGTAQADGTPTPYLGGSYGSAMLAPGSVGKTINYQLIANAASVTTFSGVTVVYDVSGLAGVATFTPTTGKCTTSGTLITCKVPKFTIDLNAGTENGPLPFVGEDNLPVQLVPVAGAVSGASGTVNVTVSSTSPATPPTTTPFTVTLGDGPDLAMAGATGYGTANVTAKADSTYSHSLTFTNAGDQPAEGVTLQVTSSGYGLDLPETHKNCQYTQGQPEQMSCYFPDLVEPGATENLSAAIKTLTYSDLMWQALQIMVQPGYAPPTSGYTNGTGAALALVDASGAAQVPVSGETSQSNLGVENVTHLDVAVTGSSANVAAVGTIWPYYTGPNQYLVDADAINDGPGYVNLSQDGDTAFTGTVTFPAGVTVETAPPGWIPVVDGSEDPGATGQPGYSVYDFYTSCYGLESGYSASAEAGGMLQITVASDFAGAAGSVSIGVDDEAATQFPQFGDIDTDPADDTASFAIPAYSD